MKNAEDFISLAIREFTKLKKLSEDAVSQISESQFFHVECEVDNSIAAIYKHLSGNMISRWTDFLSTDGEKPDRNRDEEFVILDSDTYELLMVQWEKGWRVLFEALSPLKPEAVTTSVKIRGEALSVLQAIGRQLTHYAYHTGQIVYLAKHLAGENWKSLSIPAGKSAEFNKSTTKYVEQ
jgi:hypothetical protein